MISIGCTRTAWRALDFGRSYGAANVAVVFVVIAQFFGCSVSTSGGELLDADVEPMDAQSDSLLFDGAVSDAPLVDAPPIDAPPIDATPFDAAVDAAPTDADISLCDTPMAECAPGESVACVTACSTRGHRTCTETCRIPAEVCEPPPEVCDGADNDCDGVVDDGLPFRVQNVSEVELPDGASLPEFLQTPSGLVLVYVTDHFNGSEDEYSYYALRLNDFGEAVAEPQRLGGYTAPWDVSGTASFLAVAFRGGVTIIYRVPTESRVVVQQWTVPLLPSERMEQTSSIELGSPVLASGGLRARVAATSEYVAFVLSDADGRSLHVVSEGEEGIEEIGERVSFPSPARPRPFVAEDQVFLNVRDGEHYGFHRVAIDEGVAVEPIPGSALLSGDWIAAEATGGGDVLMRFAGEDGFFRLPVGSFDCSGTCPSHHPGGGAFAAGTYHGGRWLILSSDFADRTTTLAAYEQRSFELVEGFAVSREALTVDGQMLPLANGDFGAAARVLGATEFVRYTCRPEEEP